ncbi:MAG: hypothetical protein PHS34_07875 [Candidatus Omnitrophica bacterium]|jgi:hypothetical protein|nr:hypothetical protein [Candidatus Omnitrophota bacterium]
MKPIVTEKQFEELVQSGICAANDRGNRILISEVEKMTPIAEQILKYEKEQPNTPLNQRARIIDFYGFVDGIKTKPIVYYLFGN